MANAIKVLLVDDSAVVRQVLTEFLSQTAGIEVIGAARDPLFALQLMQKQWPDVIILDIEMPRMDGITFLRKLMQERPTPVVICSSLTETGATTSLQAIAAGAVEIITKPKIGVKSFLSEARTQVIDAVRAAARARVQPIRTKTKILPVQPKLSADAVLPARNLSPLAETTDKVIAIGTSTGGTQALESVLTALPANTPGILVVQHMPEHFTHAFAQRLDTLSAMQVKEAQDGDRVLVGQVLIAPGGRHLLLRRQGAQYRVEIKDGPLVSRHRPSVDVLFRSAAQAAGANALGIIMTGMGDDGAAGLLEMKRAGAKTLAQDEASCVVFGMPKEAIRRGAVETVASLKEIPQWIGLQTKNVK
ncbi:two-component system, chemotaxis family, response regulator CheB [Allopseudospirillum japonicum]|uniref:Protein-glutamate methylesterase/protein-glutamine glutaminase n=1 Tax=Allopseudospirillum japonicum TaxID=64971 RepID=A0A1H6RUX9_9GAMM|nr:chemotaxis response regulator protein-glutamate methylesterase [Allopseudospirillum japonicum]SEI59563.1 two-component system, chemotaxis family, response regulator CheB [Allopseudospirillum japonicum]